METFIRFWRYVARFSFGLIFMLVTVGLFAKPYLAALISILTPYSNVISNNAATLATIAVAGILAASSIGLVLLSVLARALEIIVALIFGRTRFRHSIPYLTFAPVAELIKLKSLQLKAEYLPLIEAQSLAFPGNLNKPRLVARAMEKAFNSIGDTVSAGTLKSYIYFTAFSQVQSKMDSLHNEVVDLLSLLILGAAVAFATHSIAAWGLALGGTPLLSALIYHQKSELALFYASQLYAIFIISDGGEIADRDSAVT